ncbi:Pr6Pr family membrane protein [Dichotomicrobium thermohalophilum]|uniref:FAR-17a/AIG1-like protein n=1 Tax=Dichotomicrobium thermohalophilum TaxID=933063 RepID=A0A397PDC3_9HYPH|nr:Pr6Pr family membrane protein [Dichotomicrobium thermohalophilum]RIA47510.1 FAR-17a/AIG1-like protein [Dichotomicrobium thermohalophilum]
MKAGLRLLVAVVAVVGLFLAFNYGLHARIPDLLWRTLHFLSFFTILTNGIIALAMALPVLAPESAAGRFFTSPRVRTAIGGYIIIVAAVYHVMLAPLWDPKGLNLIAQIILHTIVPIAFLLDWLVYTRRGETPWHCALTALILPFLYAAWIFAHGAWTGFYPYPFLDVAELGYGQVLLNMTVLTVLFICVELLLVTIDKGLAALQRGSAQTQG